MKIKTNDDLHKRTVIRNVHRESGYAATAAAICFYPNSFL